ncbi:MAG: ribosome maturation factor RimP [Bacilli bacterium]
MEQELLRKTVSEKCLELGFELVDFSLHFLKDSAHLSLVVDRVQPIDMDTIVSLTHQLSDYLDVISPIDVPYTLDISSLGVEKPLKIESLKDYLNSYVNVHLFHPIKGENIFEGLLVNLDEDHITLSYKVKTRTMVVDIAKANISHIRLAIKF